CLGGCSKDAIAKFFANDAEPGKGDRTSWRLKLQELGGQTLEANNPRLLAATDREKLVASLIADFRTAIKIRHWLICPIPAELSTPEQEEDLYEVAAVCVDAFRAQHAQDHADDGAAAGKSAERADGEWPEPKPIDVELPSVPPFDLRLLPEALRPWIADIAERSQCPPDFLAVGAIVVCASQIARHIAIRPKRHDDWTIVPNLWGGVIAPPGFLKSPALAETLKPLHRLALDAALRYKQELRDYQTECVVQKAKSDNIEQAIRGAVKQKRDAEIEKLRSDLAELVSQPPHEARTLVNDTTIEMLGTILNQNPGGVLIFRDELAGFLRSLERQGHEADRAFYCEAWN